jgi:multidrug efflux system membrane fusion protein
MVRDLQLGPVDGEFQSILKGLKPGENVILEGVDRLREGRAVTMVTDDPTAAKPMAESAPKKSGGDPTKKRKKQGT